MRQRGFCAAGANGRQVFRVNVRGASAHLAAACLWLGLALGLAAGPARADLPVPKGLYFGAESLASLPAGHIAGGAGTGGFAGISAREGAFYGAVELEFAIGLGKAHTDGATYRIKRAASASLIGGIEAADNVVLFARVGIQQTWLSPLPGTAATSRQSTGARLGIGVDYRFCDRLRLRAEFGRSNFRGISSRRIEQGDLRLGLITEF